MSRGFDESASDRCTPTIEETALLGHVEKGSEKRDVKKLSLVSYAKTTHAIRKRGLLKAQVRSDETPG